MTTLRTDNAAFEDWGAEVCHILSVLAIDIQTGRRPRTLRDSNGNVVGTVEYSEGENT